MKTLNSYINEGLINRKILFKTPIKYVPKDKYELERNILWLLRTGISDLNCIDVSNITDMSYLFKSINKQFKIKDIDISEWNVSKVTNMFSMFYGCRKFTADLSKWDVSNVQLMNCMFYDCSEFNSDLSEWNVSKAENLAYMFSYCKQFDSDLSGWKCAGVKRTYGMFDGCDKLKETNKIPEWYKYD